MWNEKKGWAKEEERKIGEVEELVRKMECSKNSDGFTVVKHCECLYSVDFTVVLIEMANGSQIAGHLGHRSSECLAPVNHFGGYL